MRTLFIFISLFLFGTSKSISQKSELLDSLDKELRSGEIKALYELANYLGDKTKFQDHLGYHVLTNTIHNKAIRILGENCLFQEIELLISEKLTKQVYLNFLEKNNKSIIFSFDYNAFLITPPENRKLRYSLRYISQSKQNYIFSQHKDFRKYDWFKKVKDIPGTKNNEILKILSEKLIQDRDRWDEYHFYKSEIMDYLKILTHVEVGYFNGKKDSGWVYGSDDDNFNCFHVASYFLKNYRNFKWDNNLNRFMNYVDSIRPQEKETGLMEKLFYGPDSLFTETFYKVIESDPLIALNELKAVKESKFDIMKSSFLFGFVKAAVELKAYCKANNIEYIPNSQISHFVKKITQQQDLPNALLIEDSILKVLTLDNVTGFEMAGIVTGDNAGSHSFSRVLDIFYSNNLENIINDKVQLMLYIKKSFLLDKMGIIGTCNTYKWKLYHLNASSLSKINALLTYCKDKDILTEANRILKEISKKPIVEIENPSWDGNKVFNINLAEEYAKILKKYFESEYDFESELNTLFSKASYKQIPEMIQLIEKTPNYNTSRIYYFIEDDFGIPLPERKKSEIELFKINYNKLSEKELYTLYLDKAGLDYRNKNNDLDYEKIYNCLKYNINVAFIGGGGGYYEYSVYPIIKLLEIEFGTTLGFPVKCCNWQGMYGCNSIKRAKKWISFMRNKKLIPLEDKTAPTWSYQ